MATSREVAGLIHQLQYAASPAAKLRVLARAWRTLRSMSAVERYQLARQLGLEKSQELVELLAARRGGPPPKELLEALEMAEQVEPARFRELMGALRQREGRRELFRKGLDALEQTLAAEPTGEEEATTESTSEEEATAEPAFEIEAGEAAGPDEAGAGATPVVQITPPPPPAPQQRERPEPATRPQPSAAPESPVQPEPATPPAGELAAAAPEPPVPPQAEAAPPTELLPSAEPAASRWPTVAAAVTTAGEAAAGELSLFERLATTASLTRRFRLLRSSLDQVQGMETGQLRQLVASFPEGWARRRALTALLRAGLPRDLSQAMELIAGLESPRQRRWCWSALAEGRELSAAEWESIFESIGDPAIRRRLGRTRTAD